MHVAIYVLKTNNVITILTFKLYNNFTSRSIPPLSKQLDITWLAIRTIIMILKGALVQHLQTESTSEVLWVEFLAHSTDTALLYRFFARLTHLVLGNIVMVLAVRLTIVLKVVTPWKCDMTLL